MKPGIFSSKVVLVVSSTIASSNSGSLTESSLLYLLQCYSVRYLVNLNTKSGFTTDQNLLPKVSVTPGVPLRLCIGLICTKGEDIFKWKFHLLSCHPRHCRALRWEGGM